jgi:cell division protein FtsW
MSIKDDVPRAILIITVAALLGIGAVMNFSTTARGDGPLVNDAFIRQLIYIAIGLCVALLLARVDYRILIRNHQLILGIAVVLLILVLVPGIGRVLNGARRWLRFGPISFQPSEMAKLALVIYLAAFLGSRAIEDVKTFWKVFVPAALVIGLVCCFTVVEPDIGTTALMCMVSWIMLFVAGTRVRFLLSPLPVVVPVALVLVRKPYVWDRVCAFMNPWDDPQGTGYHVIQSMIAVGSGGIFGVGLGASKLKLRFLPEASSDFIFAILAEEMGLIGTTAVLLLYAGFVWAGISIARRAPDRCGYLLAAGITALVAVQAMINIGVVTKALPTKGITLPFISAGGSAMLFMLAGVGILYNIAKASRSAEPAQ